MGLNNAVVIKGQVRDAKTGSPIAKAHVYFIKGEVEQFSDSSGRFEFCMKDSTTRLWIEHPKYKTAQEVLSTAPTFIFIDLHKK
jgi:hypothetical protein